MDSCVARGKEGEEGGGEEEEGKGKEGRRREKREIAREIHDVPKDALRTDGGLRQVPRRPKRNHVKRDKPAKAMVLTSV